MKLSKMMDLHKGRPAAVLGGGPSLPADMKRLPTGCVMFMVNYHALEIGIQPDYMVYNDDPDSDALMLKAVESFGGTRLSTHPTSDVIFDVDVWTGFYSSNTAAWLALWMGCNPVILCGMDCYQGAVKYCHPYTTHAETYDYPLDNHMRPWREDGRNLLPHVERIRVMSGPLVEVFGAYAK